MTSTSTSTERPPRDAQTGSRAATPPRTPTPGSQSSRNTTSDIDENLMKDLQSLTDYGGAKGVSRSEDLLGHQESHFSGCANLQTLLEVLEQVLMLSAQYGSLMTALVMLQAVIEQLQTYSFSLYAVTQNGILNFFFGTPLGGALLEQELDLTEPPAKILDFPTLKSPCHGTFAAPTGVTAGSSCYGNFPRNGGKRMAQRLEGEVKRKDNFHFPSFYVSSTFNISSLAKQRTLGSDSESAHRGKLRYQDLCSYLNIINNQMSEQPPD
ncbi:hypothetical protein GGX14DRAFT_385779 [Mycena pura]|uniref:Uncharacterized protein n=1 Tax=Mycena pura TaxID=153505 RepID=A0AAD6YR71_9AGAR|nr:hypothetical protein GGX14DRAFT_385779 [Mycena pura]